MLLFGIPAKRHLLFFSLSFACRCTSKSTEVVCVVDFAFIGDQNVISLSNGDVWSF